MPPFVAILHDMRSRKILWFVVMTTSIMVPFLIFKPDMINYEMASINKKSQLSISQEEQFKRAWASDKNSTDEPMDTNFQNEPNDSFLSTFDSFKKNEPEPFQWCRDDNSTEPDSASFPDCEAIFAGHIASRRKARTWISPCSYTDHDMANISCNCDILKNRFHFESSPLSEEEYEFPLAFILVVEKYAEQVIRLLSSMYQPQNLFCLTYDLHASEEFKRSMNCLKECFPNVVLPSEHREIFWGDITIMDATMACMREIVNMNDHGWKYVQIISWNDLALRTNLEMVKIFKILNGSADAELTSGQAERFRKHHVQGSVDGAKADLLRPVPPDGLTIYKSSYAVSLPRHFCHFLINDPVANRLYEYCRPVWAPEEEYWSTLIHNPNLNHNSYYPGTCLYFNRLERTEKAWISRYQQWDPGQCQGRMSHGSCCFGVKDLFYLKTQPHLIAHKFYQDYQPAAWYCMLKWHYDRTYNETAAAEYPLDIKFYENLPAVRYQNMPDKSQFTC